MKIAGQSTLDAEADAIWPLIFDPGALLQLLPGCEQIEQVSPGEYCGRMTLRLPAVSGTYDARVKVLRFEEPVVCEIEGRASGPGGTVQGRASFTLHPQGPQTRIEYAGDAQVSGPLGSMSPRFVEGVAQALIGQGLARLPELARARAAAAGAAAAAEEEPKPAPARSRWARLRDAVRRLARAAACLRLGRRA